MLCCLRYSTTMTLFQSIFFLSCVYTCSGIAFTWLAPPPLSKPGLMPIPPPDVDDVSFRVKMDYEKVIPTYGRVVFDYMERNIGNGYNLSENMFRAPVIGTYMFTLILQSADKFGFSDYCIFKMKETLACTTLTMPFDQKSITVLVPLNLYEDISVVKIFDSGHNASLRGSRNWSSFAGELIKPEVPLP